MHIRIFNGSTYLLKQTLLTADLGSVTCYIYVRMHFMPLNGKRKTENINYFYNYKFLFFVYDDIKRNLKHKKKLEN